MPLDEQRPNVSVVMIQRALAEAPHYALPDGYSMRFHQAGDVAQWVRIQRAAERFFVPTADDFTTTMPGETSYLSERVLFLVDPAGTDIGTIAAWNDAEFDGREMGHIHWVAIVPEAQGRGLAKPMLSAACAALRAHGYNEAWLETGTGRIPALNLYLHFGFVPHPRTEAEIDAWQAIAPQLSRWHPTLLT